jgi:hypothetical protein
MGALIAAVPFVLMTASSAHLRLLAVVFGGVLVFDSSSGFTYPKLFYLVIVAVSLLTAWHSCVTGLRTERGAQIRRSIGIAWWLVVVIVAGSLPVALLNDHSPSLWVRDVAPYLMLACAPMFAADAALHIGRRFIIGIFVTAGLLVTAALTLQLLTLHQLSTSTLKQLAVFTGFALPVSLYTYACARAICAGKNRADVLRWGAIAGAIFAALLISGTRSAFLLIAPPVVMVITTGGVKGMVRAGTLGLLGVLMIFVAVRIGASAGVETNLVQDRLRSTQSALQAPDANPSLGDRFAQSRVAWNLVQAVPLTGVGPGYLFHWRTPSGIPRQAFTVDSTVATIAKFGVLGTAGLLVFFLMLAQLVRRHGSSAERTALAGLAAWAVVYVIITNPIEDKGLSFGLLFLLALALKDAVSAADAEPTIGTAAAASRPIVAVGAARLSARA